MNKKGFTLIELLVVIGILGILMGVVVVAVNPARQFKQARDAQRWSNVNTILNAIGQYYVDNGKLPTTITTAATEICDKKTGETTDCTTPDPDLIDLSALTPDYIVDIPTDPLCPDTTYCVANGVGYTVAKDTSDRVTVAAPDAELDTISVQR